LANLDTVIRRTTGLPVLVAKDPLLCAALGTGRSGREHRSSARRSIDDVVGQYKCHRLLADGSLQHSGQRLMSWAVANARVEPKGNAIIITKQASGSAKIDPLMAAFNAIALMSTKPWSSRPGIFVI